MWSMRTISRLPITISQLLYILCSVWYWCCASPVTLSPFSVPAHTAGGDIWVPHGDGRAAPGTPLCPQLLATSTLVLATTPLVLATTPPVLATFPT